MNKRTVLVAEDEFDIRELIKFSLEFSGYTVVTAPNGAKAVTLAKSIIPDLIMLDVRMPLMTGFEACTQIKADEKTRHIPVIFLSAKGQDTEIELGSAMGADAYILKPFAPDELSKQVTSLLAKYGK